jgi:hypothetical protein
MQSPESQKITARFFEALYALKELKVIRGKQSFTRRYEINRWNLNNLETNKAREIIQLAWLAYLINDYGISAEWLMTGKGEMLQKDKQGNLLCFKLINEYKKKSAVRT